EVVKKEKVDAEKTLLLEKLVKENQSKEILSLKDKISKLKELEEKLTITENLYLEESQLKENLEKSLEVVVKEKEVLKKNLIVEKIDKQDLPKKNNEIIQNSEEKKETNIFDYKKYGSWSNIEVYHLNKVNLVPIISTFSLHDFKEILLEGKKRELFSEGEKIQIANIITWLNLNTPLAKLNVKKVESIYIKLMESLLKEKSIQNHIEEIKSNWANKDKFLQNKANLVVLLKTFEAKDFMEMYLEGKKRGVLKSLKDKDFTNIMTRLKLKLPLTDMSLEKIEDFYESLMKNIYSEEYLIDKKINSKAEDLKFVEKNKDIEYFDIESYTAKDWYRFYDLAKEFKVKEWLQKSIFVLARFKDAKSEISDSQYATIRRNYSELYQVIEKFEAEKSLNQTIKLNYETDKIKSDINKLSSEDWYELFKIFEPTSKDNEILKKYLLSLAKYKEKHLDLTNSQIIVIKNNHEVIQNLIEKQNSKKLINERQDLNPEKENIISDKEIEKKNDGLKIEIDKDITDILF
ncbi:MAG: hypothetical protein ACRCZI_10805, partial [Cetobacterium sp.]